MFKTDILKPMFLDGMLLRSKISHWLHKRRTINFKINFDFFILYKYFIIYILLFYILLNIFYIIILNNMVTL